MWERLLKINPNTILAYNGDDEYNFRKAIENGYEVKESHLKVKKNMRRSRSVMHAAIRIDPNLIKYIAYGDNELIDKAIRYGYKPTLDDLKNNFFLSRNEKMVAMLIEEGIYDAIKYASSEVVSGITSPLGSSAFGGVILSEDTLEKLLDYITYDDVMNYETLRQSKTIIERVSKTNASVVKYATFDTSFSYDDEVIENAIKNGYSPKLDDVITNPFLRKSSSIFKVLIEDDFNNIVYYEGFDEDIFRLAYKDGNGYKPELSDFDEHHNFCLSNCFVSYYIEKDPSFITRYKGSDASVYIKAYNLGFTEEKIIAAFNSTRTRTDEINTILGVKFIVRKLINYDINIANYYMMNNDYPDEEIVDYAIGKGYKPNDEVMKKYSAEVMGKYCDPRIYSIGLKFLEKYPEFATYLDPRKVDGRALLIMVKNGFIPEEDIMEYFLYKKVSEYDSRKVMDELIPLLIEKKPEYIKYYGGDDVNTYMIAVKKGYIPREYVISTKYCIQANLDLMTEIVKIDNRYFEYCLPADKIIVGVRVDDNYFPSYDAVRNSFALLNDFEAMERLIKKDYNYILCYKGKKIGETWLKSLYDLAYDKGYRPKKEDIEEVMFDSDKITLYLIENVDLNLIEKYRGDNIIVFKKAIELGFHVTQEASFYGVSNHCILYVVESKDFNVFDYENIKASYASEYKRLFKVALELGYIPKVSQLRIGMASYLDDDLYKKIIDNSDEMECISLILKFQLSEDIIKYIYDKKGIHFDSSYRDTINLYNGDGVKLIYNFSKYKEVLKSSDIDEKDFIQYAFSVSHDWLSDMLKIDDMDEFLKVKNWFFDNFYFKENDMMHPMVKIKAFVSILKSYIRYKDICLYVIDNDVILNDKNMDKIKFLFESVDYFDNITKLSDLDNFDKIFKDKYGMLLSTIEDEDIDEVKNIICKLLFNMSMDEVNKKLHIYGDTKDLRQLLFNNRENKSITEDILEMMIYTSMMESVVYADDKKYLINMVKNILNNLELSTYTMMLFGQYDEKMRRLYEKDMQQNLTNIDYDNIPDEIKDEYMSSKYDVDVIDLTDRKYVLACHTMTTDTPDELVNGTSSGRRNTICLIAASNRGFVPYYGGIIFATDYVPEGAFLRSSVSNMSSNGSVRENSYEDTGTDSYREQRGMLETSVTAGDYNSEIFCFREGIKFKYILLPGGREPTKEELKIAKEYGLKFVKVQEKHTSIDSPKDLPSHEEKTKETSDSKNAEELKSIKEKLLVPVSGPRKIAIFSDAHALFEPTLAVLEDARKRGITEIYSLGDNIGTGPNPREVMDLIKEYNVRSLKGNHELYATGGIKMLEEHLRQTGALEEARRNSSWTRGKLSEEQLEKIKSNPESMVVEIGGKKVMLSHYTKDYNTGESRSIPDDISHVYQGHIHTNNNNDKITTVRGTGLDYNGDTSQAYYIILTENPDGGFDVEEVYVPYDTKSLAYDINESDMDDKDKGKIGDWTHAKRK